MTTTLPSLAKFTPNPNWARLPLFNRKNWSRVRFGVVVENVNDTESDPGAVGLEQSGWNILSRGRCTSESGTMWLSARCWHDEFREHNSKTGH